jgi:subtilisin family serine protease
LDDAVANAYDSGIVVVVAAGNDGSFPNRFHVQS